MISMEDNVNGRRPQWIMTSMVDGLKGRGCQGKKTSIEEYINES